jgi:hypothetical protein
MVFYNPFIMELGDIPTIVYPAQGAEKVFDRHEKGCLGRYLRGVWDIHRGMISPYTEYMIGMMWTEFANKMADLWTHRNAEGYGFGPLIDVKLFRNFNNYIPDQNKEDEEGSASGNTIVLLATEENHRVATNDPKLFLSGKRPELPERMRLNQDFYL